jgi:hypothetical protein
VTILVFLVRVLWDTWVAVTPFLIMWRLLRWLLDQARQTSPRPVHECIWIGCDRAATVKYVHDPFPVYCTTHADIMESTDAELGFPGAKVRDTDA